MPKIYNLQIEGLYLHLMMDHKCLRRSVSIQIGESVQRLKLLVHLSSRRTLAPATDGPVS